MKKFKKLIFILNILIVIILIGFKNLNSMDEILNYAFGRNIANGNIIYKDFNAVIFPLFPMVIALFLKIFGDELIIYRLLQIIILSASFAVSMNLLKKLKLDNKIKNYIILLLYIILICIFYIAEYNMFSVLTLLIIMSIELNEDKRVKDNVLIGVLAGLSITTKQSVGVCISIASILVNFFDKNSIKLKIKNIVIRLISTFCVLIGFLIYLYFTNSIYECINYTILGLKHFTNNKYSYFRFLTEGNYITALLSIFMIMGEFYIVYKVFKLKDNVFTKLFIYSISAFSIMYPITNDQHILIGYFPTLILIIYLFKNDNVLSENTINKFCNTTKIFIFLLVGVIILDVYKVYDLKEYKHYKYINIVMEEKQELNEVIGFIRKHNNTYILDGFANLFMIPLEKCNGIMDLPQIGNTGKEGQQVLIDKLNDIKNFYIFIQPSVYYLKQTQNPLEAIKYVENNYEYVGKIGRFDVYYKQ